ncbi:MAG TPA: hypothetical protein VGG64_24640 [Pirellulales bacterium]
MTTPPPVESQINTAKRLHKIFSNAKAQPTNITVHVVWRRVLIDDTVQPKTPLNNETTFVLYRSLNAIVDALDEITQAIRDTRPDEAELYLRCIEPLKAVATPHNLNDGWAASAKHLTSEVLFQLELCANSLPKGYELGADEIRDIKQAVMELIEQVKASDLAKPLRRWVLDLLSSVLRSIDLYDIHGAKAFGDSLASMIGQFAMHQKSCKDVAAKHKGIWQKLVSIAGTLNTIVIKAKEWYPLLEAGRQATTLLLEQLNDPGAGPPSLDTPPSTSLELPPSSSLVPPKSG